MAGEHEGRGTLADILAARKRLADDPGQTIDREQVMRWAASPDLAARGALSELLFDPEDSRRIDPNLTLPEYMAIELPYLERCLEEDPQDGWADSRWAAGRILQSWIRQVWADERVRRHVDDFRDWLARLYKEARDPGLRTCIVQATLEHLFELDGIADRFASWQDDADLAPAYREAKLWQQGLRELGAGNMTGPGEEARPVVGSRAGGARSDTRATLERASALVAEARPLEAVALLEEALTAARHEQDAAAVAWLAEHAGLVSFAAGRNEQTVAFLEEAVRNGRADPYLHLTMAEAYGALDELDAARARLASAAELARGDRRLLSAVEEVATRLGRR